ncbi:unnamed protein product [Adineta ricciae]|uniref:HAT C-terminal dimerisation domain-containing protein n=1 Tax=Adineta ricciae TaxID=249248 RepID=A0A814TDN4_ADIRI|nr:unnamed protein product [Adineta ricciae]CAF1460243.1 unnamed protein product [Adineta ricciae]
MNKIVVDLQVPPGTLQVASIYASLSRVKKGDDIAVLRPVDMELLQVQPSSAQDAELKRLDELDKKDKTRVYLFHFLKHVHIKSKYIDIKGKFCGITTQVESFIPSNLGQSKYNTASTKHEANLSNDRDQDNLDDSDTNDGEPDANVYKHKKTNNSISFRSDHLWNFLLDGEHVPDLRKLIEFAFAIPAANSFCESVFSQMQFLWNNNRNKMNQNLAGAELKIKLNTHLTCTKFDDYLLTKPDILKKSRSSDGYSHIAKVPRIHYSMVRSA